MPGARLAPAALCAKSKKHTSIATTVTPVSPGIPRANGFNGFLRALPGDRAFLPPSPRNAKHCRELTSASRYQDHTTSPSANGAFVSAPSASTASPLTFVTIAKRPSLRDGMIRFYCCFYQAVKNNFGKSEIAANLRWRRSTLGSVIVLDFRFIPMGKQGTGLFRPLVAWFESDSGLI
jgi:hypothetical protein